MESGVKIETRYSIQDRVVMMGDHSIIATVQRVIVSMGPSGLHVMYEVFYFDSSGVIREPGMYEWQLEMANEA